MSGHRNAIGISLGDRTATIVRVQSGHIAESHELILHAADTPSDALPRLLDLLTTTTSAWRPLPLVVALGPAHMQLRQITGVPERIRAVTLTAIVRQSPDRYFLRSGEDALTSSAVRLDEGGWWASSVSASMLGALYSEARARRLRLIGVLPVAAALGAAVPDGPLEWIDGSRRVRADYHRGALRQYRVLPAGDDALPSAPTVLCAPLAALGSEDALRYAAAYSATRATPRTPLLVPGEGTIGVVRDARHRRQAAVAACLASVLIAAAMPGIVATRAEQGAREELDRLAATTTRHRDAEVALAGVVGDLVALSAHERTMSSMTLRLAALTETLEAPTMLVSLRADSTGGTLVAITPNADGLIEMLEDAPFIADATILGAVLPEATSAVLQPQPESSSPPMPPSPPRRMFMPRVGMPAAFAPPAATTSPPADEPAMERLTVRFAWRRAVPKTAGSPVVAVR